MDHSSEHARSYMDSHNTTRSGEQTPTDHLLEVQKPKDNHKSSDEINIEESE